MYNPYAYELIQAHLQELRDDRTHAYLRKQLAQAKPGSWSRLTVRLRQLAARLVSLEFPIRDEQVSRTVPLTVD